MKKIKVKKKVDWKKLKPKELNQLTGRGPCQGVCQYNGNGGCGCAYVR